MIRPWARVREGLAWSNAPRSSKKLRSHCGGCCQHTGMWQGRRGRAWHDMAGWPDPGEGGMDPRSSRSREGLSARSPRHGVERAAAWSWVTMGGRARQGWLAGQIPGRAGWTQGPLRPEALRRPLGTECPLSTGSGHVTRHATHVELATRQLCVMCICVLFDPIVCQIGVRSRSARFVLLCDLCEVTTRSYIIRHEFSRLRGRGENSDR